MIIGLPIGIMQSNCYLVYDENSRDGVIVDAGGDTVPLLEEIHQREIKVQYILNTHGHFDHIAGNAYLSSLNVPFGIHPDDRDLLVEGGGASWFNLAYVSAPTPTLDLNNDLILNIGELKLHVLHTPGHTPGSVCFYVPQDKGVITGDTLFAGSVGRTDLPGGDARRLSNSIKKLLTLPPETVIYPGHGPTSNLAKEQRTNPWLRWINHHP